MKATTTVLALAAVAGAQAGTMQKRHEHHHKRGGYDATPAAADSCKPVVTGMWVKVRDVAPPANPPPPPPPPPQYFTYHPESPCTVPTPVVTACNTPGTYVFPEQNVVLAAPTDVNGQHYEAGSYCQTAATYTVVEPTTITCPFGYTAPSKPATPPADYPKPQEQGSAPPQNQGSYGGDDQNGQPGGYGSDQPADDTPAPKPKGGKQLGITYSPYQDQGGCRPHDAIANDIAQIAAKGFQTVRVYSTDCDTLEVVGPACRKNKMQMIVGAFLKDDNFVSGNKDVDALVKWGSAGNWDLVRMVVLGNEAIQGKVCDFGGLVGFLKSGSAKLKGAGCKAPITTAETLNVYEDHKDLCDHIDVAGFNCHPFFNAQNTPNKSGGFLDAELKELSGICGGKEAYSLETGWPNNGQANGAAVPGGAQQAEAFKSIYEADSGNVVYFTWKNDGWKGPGAFNVERNFGCGNLFRSGGGVGGGY